MGLVFCTLQACRIILDTDWILDSTPHSTLRVIWGWFGGCRTTGCCRDIWLHAGLKSAGSNIFIFNEVIRSRNQNLSSNSASVVSTNAHNFPVDHTHSGTATHQQSGNWISSWHLVHCCLARTLNLPDCSCPHLQTCRLTCHWFRAISKDYAPSCVGKYR